MVEQYQTMETSHLSYRQSQQPSSNTDVSGPVSERGDLSIENERGGDCRETADTKMGVNENCSLLDESQKLRTTSITTADEEIKSTMLGSNQQHASAVEGVSDYQTFKSSNGSHDGASMCS